MQDLMIQFGNDGEHYVEISETLNLNPDTQSWKVQHEGMLEPNCLEIVFNKYIRIRLVRIYIEHSDDHYGLDQQIEANRLEYVEDF